MIKTKKKKLVSQWIKGYQGRCFGKMCGLRAPMESRSAYRSRFVDMCGVEARMRKQDANGRSKVK